MNDLAILEQQLRPLAPRFEQVLAGLLPVGRLIQSVLISVERAPKLLECRRETIFQAAMSAACLGLPIDGVTSQAFMIPFKERAQLVIGYKGFNTLAARDNITITGRVVREGEPFDYQLGSGGYVRHKPLGDPSARITWAWAMAQHNNRPPIIEVLSIAELMAVKAKSPGARKSDSPWNDPSIGFPAMCEKTPKRRLSRSLPMVIMQVAARLDEAVEEQGRPAWITPEGGLQIEGAAEKIGPFETSATPSLTDLTEDPEIAQQRAALEEIARDLGTESLKTAWAAIAKRKIGHVLAPELDRIKKIAADTDARLAAEDAAHEQYAKEAL